MTRGKTACKAVLIILSISVTGQYLWWIGEMLGWLFDWCQWPTITKDWQLLACGSGVFFTAEMTLLMVRNLFEETS